MSLFKRKGKWYVRLRYNGQDVWRATRTTNRRLAEQCEAQLKLDMAQDRFGLKDEGSKRSFEELAKKYAREDGMQKAAKTQLRDKISLQHLLPVFANKYLNQITPNMINDYKVLRRNEKASASSINKELALAKHLYYVAIRQFGWIAHNPFMQVPLEKMPPGRVKYLQEDEYSRLCAACDEQLRPIVVLAVNTGLRLDNITSLVWQQINFKNGTIVVEHTKNHERLGVPMNQTVKNLLSGLNRVRRIDTPYVFYTPAGAKLCNTLVSRRFKQASKRAGLEDFRFHDLRHHFASMLVQNGVDRYVVQRLLGHKTAAMTERYAHLAPDNLRGGVEVLDKVGDVVAKTVAGQVEGGHEGV